MLTAWSETDTWKSFGGDGIRADGAEAASSADATTGSTSSEPTSITVTERVQAWVDGQTNYGWAFLPSGNDGWDFYSAEGTTPPGLAVTYRGGSGGGETTVAVSTDTATDVGETSATLNGTLDDLGGASSADVLRISRTWNEQLGGYRRSDAVFDRVVQRERERTLQRDRLRVSRRRRGQRR